MGAAEKIEIRGEKGGSSSPKTPIEAADSLRSTNLAKILIAVGEGEFDGVPTARDIYLDNTPIEDASGNVNFPNVKWEWRTGAVDQSYIPGIPSVENETTVNVELRTDTAWVRSLTNTQLSAVRLRFAWPALQQQDDEGNVGGYRIEYAVDIATDGGAYQQVLDEAVDGKTTTRYERSRRIDLPTATSGWQVRVRRLTPNQNTNKIADTMLVAGYTEVIDAKLRYPNTALLYIEFDAEQFTNIPAVTVDCNARKWQVPSNYDPVARTYSGAWDGTLKEAWTNNAAWITYGVCVQDLFGLGRRIKPWMVDKWELYRIAQYCDQAVPDGLGGVEPRYLCDMNLQGKAEAWTLLRDISAIYRGMTYWAQGQLVAQADMPRAQDFDYVFTRANVIDGKFSYGSASSTTRYTRAIVSYDNPANNYDTDVTAYADPVLQRRFGDKPVEISAIGCTRASEAQRRGKWVVMSNNQDRTVTFKTGMEGAIPLPGYIIPVADSLLAGREVGGRISSAAGRVVTLDRDTLAKVGDRLVINLPSGKAEGRTVQSVAGRAITLTTAYSETPTAQLQWAIDADDLAIPLYRVLSTKRTTEGDYEISALQFEPGKFAFIDTGAKLEERPISVIPITVVPAPASVTLTSNTAIAQGLAVTTMTISWPAVTGAVAYDVEWRKDNGNWIKVQRAGTTSVDITGIYSGGYLARVRAVSAYDISSIWRSSVLTQLTGKVGLPPAVTSLVTTSLLFGIGLKWAFPPGADDTQRTEIWYGPTPSLAAATKLADLAYPQSDYSMQSLLAGASFFFWARLVDRTGNIGPFFPVGNGVQGQASSDAGPILDQIAGQIGETELGQELLGRIDLIDGPPEMPGSVRNQVETVRSDLAEQVTAVNDSLNETRTELQGQIDAIGDIADSAKYDPARTYTLGQSVLADDGKLYQATSDVPANSSPPNTSYWTDVGQAVSTANGLAARVTTSETKIGTLEGVTTSQASQITGLQSSLTTTNGNVTAAQNAANAANTLAGGKGKVLVQSTTPVAADQLAQNLWIDTTGNANTPKRWTGSGWAAVTDKAATDAAAAAANALAVANTKADASALNSLTTRVTSAEGTISSQGSAITGLNNSLTTTNTNVTAAQNAANAANTLAGGKGKVLFQTATPAAADQLAQNLWIDITGNANTPKRWNGSAWAVATDKAATDAAAAAANALAVANTKADSSVVNSLTSRVTSAEGTISSQGSAITGLNNSLTTTNGNVSAAQTAADNAATLAGSKGKTLVQTATPGAADQLAQNLWIDITGGANTPKRWNGSAWSAVTDKVATDAAAAAANALSVANTKADAAALNSLTSRVTSSEGTISSQGSAITSLNNSLTTTNSNVTTAQQAADAAATLAGSKGKTLVQSTTPVAADQLAQNLWIDTTNNANTPKRWNGSAWVAVTDKIATDAAAAAANALSVANTKADSSAVTSLASRVTATESAITSQGSRVTSLENSVNSTSTGLSTKASASAVDALTNRVTAAEGVNTSQSSSITDLNNSVTAIQGNLGASGLDPAPSGTWQFDSTVEGWVPTGATLTAATGAVTLTATAAESYMTSPVLSFSGALYSRVRAKITRKAGATTDWDGQLMYSTSAHAASASYRKVLANPNLAVGASAVVEWDMSALTTGGTDWTSSTITGIRMDLSSVSGGSFEIDWVAVGRVGPGASSSALQSLTSTVTQQGATLTSQAASFQSLQASVRGGDDEGELADALRGWETVAAYSREVVVRATQSQAQVTATETLQASVADNSALVQQTSAAYADTSGKLSTMWSVKMQINAQGQYVAAGIGLGIENTAAGLQSQFLVSADRFAVVNGTDTNLSVPFAVQGGQVFINAAFIQDGTITNAKIGSYISSTNYVAGQTGWILNKDGTLEINGAVAGQGRLVVNNQFVAVYDANNVLRVKLGNLG